MQNLDVSWDEIVAVLKSLPGWTDKTATGLKKHFQPEQGPEKVLFFKVRYDHGEIIMPKGGFSDYAAVHLRGAFRVSDEAPALPALPSCWQKTSPWWRRVMDSGMGRFLGRFFGRGSDEGRISVPTSLGMESSSMKTRGPFSVWKDSSRTELLDIPQRFLGVTSVVWRRPRTVTLIAEEDDGAPCEVLLIKRRALLDLLFTPGAKGGDAVPTALYRTSVAGFLNKILPDILATNRLFRSVFYVEEVLAWPTLLQHMREPTSSAARRVRGLFSETALARLAAVGPELLDDDKYLLTSALNEVMGRQDFYAADAWPLSTLAQEERTLLERGIERLAPNELSRLNRLLVEAAFPGCFESRRGFRPSTADDFKAFGDILVHALGTDVLPLRPREGEVVIEENAPADTLYLILSGRLRVTGREPDGTTLIYNHLTENGFIGESCFGTPEQAIYRARVEAMTSATLLPISAAAVRALADAFPDFGTLLLREQQRIRRRDYTRKSGQRIPPSLPPPHMVPRLLRATNLLVIDMERCTRCDQCVQACHTAHEDRPRFHRANPDLRFGKWEVAAACVHCVDAPCLEECPVGAITFLDSGAVHIHRNRCIGCERCKYGCPYRVIDMHLPTSPEDGKSLPKNKELVATKCDLCLTQEHAPPCVMACPYGAAQRGAPEEFFAGLRGWSQFADMD